MTDKKYKKQLNEYVVSLNNSLNYSLSNIKHFQDEITFIKKRIAYEKKCVKLISANIKSAKRELNQK